MSAGRGNLERAARRGLAAHVGQVVERGLGARRPGASVRDGQLRLRRAARSRSSASEPTVRTSTPSTSAASAALARGDDGALHAARPRAEELREHAAQRLHRALERQLADEEHALERLARRRAERAQRGRGDGEVEPAAGLLHVGRREVDDDAALADVDAHVRQRALHAHAALANGRLGEADELEERRTRAGLDLDANGVSVETDERGAERGGEHGPARKERSACRAGRTQNHRRPATRGPSLAGRGVSTAAEARAVPSCRVADRR